MPVGCLLDTGAMRTRMSAELAPLAGIELPGALTEDFFIGGLKTAGALARVNLTVNDGADDHDQQDCGERTSACGKQEALPGAEEMTESHTTPFFCARL